MPGFDQEIGYAAVVAAVVVAVVVAADGGDAGVGTERTNVPPSE